MKKIMVCGCSFSATSLRPEYAGTSWSEVLAKNLGWELQNIARQGVSNGGIRLQIDEVIRQKPAFAIIGPTSFARIEIPSYSIKNNHSVNILKSAWTFVDSLLREKPPKGYDRNLGLDNINYGDNDSRLISETIFSLTREGPHSYRKYDLDIKVREAVSNYILYMYDSEWKKQQDEWILRDGFTQLHKANIPFLILNSFNLFETIEKTKMLFSDLAYDKYLLDNDNDCPVNIQHLYPYTDDNDYTKDPGYHTSPEGQIVLAKKYYDLIKNRWGLL
jgi:hypothetical protein